MIGRVLPTWPVKSQNTEIGTWSFLLQDSYRNITFSNMIECFGPLVGQWTMRFEAKHSFFKEVARHTNCFKNIPLTLATKHQQMIAYHINASHLKSSLEVTNLSTLPVDVLNKEVVASLRQKYPMKNEVHLAKNATNKGISYRIGMLISYGATSGLAEKSSKCVL